MVLSENSREKGNTRVLAKKGMLMLLGRTFAGVEEDQMRALALERDSVSALATPLMSLRIFFNQVLLHSKCTRKSGPCLLTCSLMPFISALTMDTLILATTRRSIVRVEGINLGSGIP